MSTDAGGTALVAGAVETYGRLDALINNAGIVRWAGPPDADLANLDAHLDVHLRGAFSTARAAWPHFVAQNYGRVVMTTSSGIFGLPQNLSYAAAKGGVIGLTRSLATAGRKVGIAVNAIAPAAATRMGMPDDETTARALDPALVAPMAAYLAHEDCPVTGEIYTAGAGRFARLFIGSTPGYVAGTDASVEAIAGNWDAINDEAGYVVPRDLMSWSASFTRHLDPG